MKFKFKFTYLLKKPKNIVLLIGAIIGLFLFILINQLIFIPLSQSVPTYGILDFEFAWTPERVLSIFTAWGTQGIEQQILGVYWDFLYIIGYVSLIFCCLLLVSRRMKGRVQVLGIQMVKTPLLAGIFDVIENINLLILLSRPPILPFFATFVASLSACIKFSLLAIGIIFFFVALIILIVQLIQKK